MFSEQELEITVETVVWAVLVLAATPYIVYIVPQILGADAYIVTSGSMNPSIPEGSVVYETEPNIEQLGEGDVIIFQSNNPEMTEDTVVHRIIDTRIANYTKEFKTQGDSNPNPDPGWTSAYNVVGQKAFSIPYLGTIIQISNTPWFVIALVGMPATILLKNQISNLLKELEQKEKQENTAQKRIFRAEGED